MEESLAFCEVKTSLGALCTVFLNIIHWFISLQIFSRHKINDCIIFVICQLLLPTC